MWRLSIKNLLGWLLVVVATLFCDRSMTLATTGQGSAIERDALQVVVRATDQVAMLGNILCDHSRKITDIQRQMATADTPLAAAEAGEVLLASLHSAREAAASVLSELPLLAERVHAVAAELVDKHLSVWEGQVMAQAARWAELEVEVEATRNLAVAVSTGRRSNGSAAVLAAQKRQWHMLLGERMRWLEEEAHAPLLANRVRASLWAMEAETFVAKPYIRSETSFASAREAARSRVAVAEVYLANAEQVSQRCLSLAQSLIIPEHSGIHEQKFIELLRCQKRVMP